LIVDRRTRAPSLSKPGAKGDLALGAELVRAAFTISTGVQTCLLALVLCMSCASADSKAPDEVITLKEMLANVQDQHNRTYLRGVWDALESANASLQEHHQKQPVASAAPISGRTLIGIRAQHDGFVMMNQGAIIVL
jgi:hypothetical protein